MPFNHLNRVVHSLTFTVYNSLFEFQDTVKQADQYAYDANGHLTQDLNKGIIGIQYNMLNLPSTVTLSNVIHESGTQELLLTDRRYHYYLQDHQGNNRVVVNQSGAVEEANHYYLLEIIIFIIN